jgi:hypothetical protein
MLKELVKSDFLLPKDKMNVWMVFNITTVSFNHTNRINGKRDWISIPFFFASNFLNNT